MNGRRVPDAGRAALPGLKVLFITEHAENALVGNSPLEPGMPMLAKPFACQTVRDGGVCQRIKELTIGP